MKSKSISDYEHLKKWLLKTCKNKLCKKCELYDGKCLHPEYPRRYGK